MDNSTAQSANSAIESFINELIEDRGFLDLTDEVRAELKKDLSTRLDDFLTARMIAALSDTDVLTFENMLKEGKSESEVQQFLSEHIPDFTNFLTNALLEFRGVYLGEIESPPGIETQSNSDVPPAPPSPAPVSN